MSENNSSNIEFENIYADVDATLPLFKHYGHYPNHPWNKWRLHRREDDKKYEEDFLGEDDITRTWYGAKGTICRIGAPSYFELNSNYEVDFEECNIRILKHRVDGPEQRGYGKTRWRLLHCKLTPKHHKEIVSLYNQLNDWQLAFALSSFENYDENSLYIRINTVLQKN